MRWYLLALAVLVLQTVVLVQCFLHRRPRAYIRHRDVGDPGKPLILTPYIERGHTSEAQRLARVNITENLQIKSYAGFFTVNKTYDSNHFFLYFPATDQDTTEAPVIVWLQGGPGDSSLLGAFFENGPIYVENGQLMRRMHHWALRHHIIYIDNPVGAGFSFTNDSRGYCTDAAQIGEQLYSTVTQFFKVFPELQQNKFFVSGESYGGKHATALAYMIHKKNPTAEVKINLKGITIGNGLIDPENQNFYSEYLYQLGLIDWNKARVYEKMENEVRELMSEGSWYNSCVAWDAYVRSSLYDTDCACSYNYAHTRAMDNFNYVDFLSMIKKTFFRKALHVGQQPFDDYNDLVVLKLIPDVAKSVAPWMSELLSHYNVLTYNGQLDVTVAYPTTVNYLRKLKFSGSEEYETAKRHIWRVGGEVAGYVKKAGNLTEVMVRNAGHMVPADQPEWALDLITSFTYDLPMYTNV